MKTIWFLDDSGLPDLLWARLQVSDDGSSYVFDLDGVYHHFSTESDALLWLAEDEYKERDYLVEVRAISSSTNPPVGKTDAELIPHMLVKQGKRAGFWAKLLGILFRHGSS